MATAPADEVRALERMLEMTAARRHELRDFAERLQQMDENYSSLATSLRELPSKIAQPILVPFGSLAFFPGALQHTNEVTVLLGDNYFAKCSADNAARIAESRAANTKPRLDETREEINELTTRIEQIRALGQLGGLAAPGEFEIREPYEEEEAHRSKSKSSGSSATSSGQSSVGASAEAKPHHVSFKEEVLERPRAAPPPGRSMSSSAMMPPVVAPPVVAPPVVAPPVRVAPPVVAPTVAMTSASGRTKVVSERVAPPRDPQQQQAEDAPAPRVSRFMARRGGA